MEVIKIFDNIKSISLNLEPKVTFTNELWVGMVKIPVNTELDFSGVHHLQHERVLNIAHKIYCVDKKINKI